MLERATLAGVDRVTLRRTAPLVALIALVARAVSAFLIPPLRPPGLLDVVLVVVAVGCAATVVLIGPVPRGRLIAAAVAAVFWLSSALSGVLDGQGLPVAAAAMAAVAVALICGTASGPALLRVAVIAGALVVVLSLGYGLLSATGVATGAFHSVGDYERLTFGVPALAGIATHPNLLGPIAGFTLLAGGCLALANRHRPGAWWIPAAALVCLVWTQSRASILVVILAAAVGVLVTRRPTAAAPAVGVAMMASLAPPFLTLLLGGWLPLGRVFNGRDLAWGPAFRTFLEHPLVGYGPDAFTRSFWRALPDQAWQPLHAHNEVLETAAQAGLLGLLALAAMAGIALVLVATRSGRNGVLVSVLVTFVALLGGVEVPLGVTYFPASYLLPGLVLAAVCYAGSHAWRAGGTKA